MARGTKCYFFCQHTHTYSIKQKKKTLYGQQNHFIYNYHLSKKELNGKWQKNEHTQTDQAFWLDATEQQKKTNIISDFIYIYLVVLLEKINRNNNKNDVDHDGRERCMCI